MKKIIFSIIFVFGILITNVSAETNYLDAYLALKKGAVSITVEYADNSGASCSGIVIKQNTQGTGILTAKHCLEDEVQTIYINRTYDTTEYILAEDIDVAYIWINEQLPFNSSIELASNNVNINDTILLLGYPTSQEYFQIGIADRIVNNNQFLFASVIPGVSGAGVVNIKGELVGIIWAKVNALFDTKIAIMTPIEKIISFLNSINVITTSSILVH